MVHYELAESEWNLLDDCVKQMTLITDLCGHITSGSKTISVGGLESFISRQQDTLRETLRSVALLQIVGGDKLIIPFC